MTSRKNIAETMIPVIDTHAHIYASDFESDLPEVISRARQAGVARILLPNIDETTLQPMSSVCRDYPELCAPMLALHPTSVGENYRDQLALIESWLDRLPWVAIGETGLDFYWDTTFKVQQTESFLCHVDWASRLGLPLVIHSRRAHRELVELLRPRQRGNLRGIFHCFGGSYEEARELIDLGFLLGIGGVVTFQNARLAGVVARLGPEHLVLETDAPYLAPVPFRGQRNEPAYLQYVAGKIASVTGTTPEQVKEITTRNASRLFGL